MTPDRIGGLRLAAQRIGLPAWFITIDVVYRIFAPETLGIDARHYQRAADAWLSGGDPWIIAENGIPYASGPHTLLFYAPTSLLPLPMSVGLWTLAGLVAALWLIRRLELPVWWITFPPLAHGIWNANPQTIALALLVAGGPLAASAAVGLKLYAAVPLVTRWRELVIAIGLLAVTLPLIPIGLYVEHGAGVSSHLDTAWNGSAWRVPLLVPPTLLSLWVLRRRGAEWLAVPAAFPATQLYYNAMALPVLVRQPWLACALAIPVPLLPPIAVMALAASVWLRTQRVARAAAGATVR